MMASTSVSQNVTTTCRRSVHQRSLPYWLPQAWGALDHPAPAGLDRGAAAAGSASTQESRATFPAHGTPAHENLEKPVTGAAASAAAVKAVGGGTAGAVTTDVSGNGYEVTVTKSDGSKVEVHLDQSFNLDDRGRLGG
jgi:hypothetical protein